MTFERPDLPGVYDRTSARPNDSALIFHEDRFLQGAELNDMQGILGRQTSRIGNLSARDGDRRSGAFIEVKRAAGEVRLGAGEVYVQGDVRPVAEASFSGLDMAGTLVIGVRLISKIITSEDEPGLLGLKPGSEAEGEKGADREEKRLIWGYVGDGGEGQLYPVYTLDGGTPLDQSRPSELSETAQAIALQDVHANGNYIVEGCHVTPLGEDDGNQVFSIAAGIANINGFKRTREHALRLAVPEVWDAFQIDGEQHTYDVEPDENYTINLRNGPLDSIVLIQLEKEVTESVTRSATLNGSDPLSNDSVKEIVEIKQGNQVFVKGTDYQLTNDRPDWSLGGGEPDAGSRYTVKYRYRDAVQPESISAHQVVVTGGRKGGEVLIAYKRRLPRIDLICLNEAGAAVPVTGQSAVRPVTPPTPSNLLKLATVYNDFDGVPRVENDGTHNFTYDDISALYYRLQQGLDLIALNRLQLNIHDKEPAAKKGMFVDPFVDDRWRDKGEEQNAATRNGMLTLPLAVTTQDLPLGAVEALPYVVETVVEQPVRTTCKQINRFANHDPFPAKMSLTPASDYWTEVRETWASDVSHRVFGPQASQTVEQQVIGVAQQNAEFLRAVEITVEIDGFGDGEILDKVLFDNVDMTPDPNLVGDENGRISLTLQVPAGKHAAGEKLVEAYGRGGSEAFGQFVGEGTITTQTMQRVTTLVVVPPPPRVVTVERIITRNRDPRGQIWLLPPGPNRHAATAWLWFCKIGNPKTPVVVELRETNSAGYPTDAIIAQAELDMATVETGKPTTIAFPSLPFLLSTRRYALIAITPDTEHSISAAVLGGFDDVNQRHLGANPYTVGAEVESSTNSTWVALHGSDLAFGIGAARFTSLTKRVSLGTLTLDRCSDLSIAAAVDLPEAGCSVIFEITRANGEVYRVAPFDPVQFDDWLTEEVSVEAVLSGTETASPRLFPGIQARMGQLAQTARYVSRSFDTDNATRFPVRLKRTLPTGAQVDVFLKDASGSWVKAPEGQSEVLDAAGVVDATYELAQALGQQTAIRIDVTGSPNARPVLQDLRATATI